MMRRLLPIAVLLAAGCAGVPFDYPKIPTEAIPASPSTTLGAEAAKWSAAHGGMSGFIPLVEGNDSLDVPESFVRRRNTYVLLVRGDSMVDEGILDGDHVVVEEKPTPSNGDMVVASIDGEATVKRFYREDNGAVRLQPANRKYQPIMVRDRDLQIRGVVVGVLRRYF